MAAFQRCNTSLYITDNILFTDSDNGKFIAGLWGVVVASSGFDQRAEDGWTRLENDQMIVASNRTGEFRVRSI